MKFDISIKNFGKVNNAQIKIRPFTVIAGQNSSGKSFVTKSLYSFFSTANADHITIGTFNKIDSLKFLSSHLHKSLSNPSKLIESLCIDVLDHIDAIETIASDIFQKNTFSRQIDKSFLLQNPIDKLELTLDKLNIQAIDKIKYSSISQILPHIYSTLNTLKSIINNPNDFFLTAIENGTANSLKENFQVSSLHDLKNYHVDGDPIIDIDTLGTIRIKKEAVSFKINSTDSIDKLQELYNVVYIESPVYWKMKDALKSVRDDKLLRGRRLFKKTDYLVGVPKHFYDLVDLLEDKAKSGSCVNILNKTINETIGGEIIISESGEFYFKENGYEKSINLHTTALGVTNLGIISLLLERGVLAKGSYLFVDEPEVHLHPAWQKIMIDTLFTLSKQGINVVIASHSIDMMKCIENIMEDIDDENGNFVATHFGINQLSTDGNSINDSDNPFKRIAAIKEDLGKSFYEMFIDSKW